MVSNIPFFPGARRNTNCSVLTVFVKAVYAKELDGESRISALNITEFLKCVVIAHNAASLQGLDVLKTRTQGQKASSYSSIIAVSDFFCSAER